MHAAFLMPLIGLEKCLTDVSRLILKITSLSLGRNGLKPINPVRRGKVVKFLLER